jgi:hypothetical protein
MSAVNLAKIDAPPTIGATTGIASQRPHEAFSGILKSIERQEVMPESKNGDIHKELLTFQANVLGGKEVTSAQLIALQIRASRFHIKVDLISKAAESFLATTRKFQSGQ